MLLSVLGLVLSLGAPAQGVKFEDKSLADLLVQAKAEQKLVFIDCYTTWCGPCKRMAAEVFPQQSVGDFMNARFVSAKFDMEKGEAVLLGRKWDVNAYPTYMVLDADGQEKFNLVGFFPPQQLIDTLTYKLAHCGPTEMEKRYQAGERSAEVVYGYVKELEKNRKRRLLEQVLTGYLNDHQEQLLTDTTGLKYFQQYVQDPATPIFLYVYDHRADFIAKYGEAFGQQLENKWSMHCKSFYIMNDSVNRFEGYDPQKMDEYEQFMKTHGVAAAANYVMNYKLPGSFAMHNKKLLLDNLEACIPLKGISQSQFDFGCRKAEEWGLSEQEQQRLARIKEDRKKHQQQ